jgi:hypothetical protein
MVSTVAGHCGDLTLSKKHPADQKDGARPDRRKNFPRAEACSTILIADGYDVIASIRYIDRWFRRNLAATRAGAERSAPAIANYTNYK